MEEVVYHGDLVSKRDIANEAGKCSPKKKTRYQTRLATFDDSSDDPSTGLRESYNLLSRTQSKRLDTITKRS